MTGTILFLSGFFDTFDTIFFFIPIVVVLLTFSILLYNILR